MGAAVVVVGAGVIGCAVALEFARDRDVIVVDPMVGGTATEAAGAMLGALGEVTASEPIEDRVARRRAAAIYSSWLDALATWGDPPASGRGTTVVASSADPDDLPRLEEIRRAAVDAGARADPVDPSALDLSPARDRALVGALHLPDEGWIDAPILLERLRSAVERHPRIEVRPDRVVALVGDRQAVTGLVTESEGAVSAGHVVVCAGAATTRLLETIDAEEALPGVFPGKGTALLLDLGRELEGVVRTPNRAFACGLHLVPRPGGRAYLGATNRVSTVAGVTGRATAGEVHLLLETALHQLDTRLERVDILAVVHGERPLSADRRPLIGVTDVDGLAVATGTYRNGVLLAPLAAELTRREVDAGQPVADNPFSCPGRSAELRARVADVRSVLRRGSRELTMMLLEPSGHLPYSRAELLNDLLSTAMLEILEGDGRGSTLSRELLSMLPLEEVVPEIAILLAREGPQGDE